MKRKQNKKCNESKFQKRDDNPLSQPVCFTGRTIFEKTATKDNQSDHCQKNAIIKKYNQEAK